jgi:hypothetical protein
MPRRTPWQSLHCNLPKDDDDVSVVNAAECFPEPKREVIYQKLENPEEGMVDTYPAKIERPLTGKNMAAWNGLATYIP